MIIQAGTCPDIELAMYTTPSKVIIHNQYFKVLDRAPKGHMYLHQKLSTKKEKHKRMDSIPMLKYIDISPLNPVAIA